MNAFSRNGQGFLLPHIAVLSTANGGEPFTVRMHFRDLGENRHPSLEKIIAAQALGIELADNQTFVVEHTKNRPTAA